MFYNLFIFLYLSNYNNKNFMDDLTLIIPAKKEKESCQLFLIIKKLY